MEEKDHRWHQSRPHSLPRLYDLKKLWNPSWFQGNRKQSNYFEGWYLKVVNSDRSQAWAFIPGISIHAGDPHAFIQLINGTTGETWYFRYPVNAFHYSRNSFHVRIGESFFSDQGMQLNIQHRSMDISGEICFHDIQPLTASLKRPGIMGWYRYMPFMECYHGVVSLNHTLSGKLNMNGRDVLFDKGKGYIEKDWGSSMPKAWIWMQSNHFEQPDASFMLSVADIPWMGKSFEGFLGFLLIKKEPMVFATYTGARIIRLEKQHQSVSITVKTKQWLLHIHGTKQPGLQAGGALKAPVSGGMNRIIHESMHASLHVKVTDHFGNIHFEDTGTRAGLEIVEATG